MLASHMRFVLYLHVPLSRMLNHILTDREMSEVDLLVSGVETLNWRVDPGRGDRGIESLRRVTHGNAEL